MISKASMEPITEQSRDKYYSMGWTYDWKMGDQKLEYSTWIFKYELPNKISRILWES